MKKSYIFILIILLVSLWGIPQIIKNGKRENIDGAKSSWLINLKKKKEPVITKVYFVGDIMLARGVESSVNKNFDGDFSNLFKNVPELKEADILFGNLEGPISDKGNNVGSIYSFRFNPLVLPALKEMDFNVLSFANNHVGDWNVKAFDDTLVNLKENNILVTGAGENSEKAREPAIIEKNGIRFGFLGFSDVGPNWLEAKENSSGILLASDPNYESIITEAKEKCDYLIVSIHFGEEYKPIRNNRQEILAHSAVDAGADFIIGHHPHVIQDMEHYQDKPIIYSLGNFIFDQHFSKETMRGMVYMLTFEGKELIKEEKMISVLNKKYQPEGLFKEDQIEDIEEVVYSTCPKPDKEYEDMALLNVGRNISLPEQSYIPKNLVKLDSSVSVRQDICLTQETKKALKEMIVAAEKDGLNIKVTSAFRDFNYQNNLYQNALKNNPDPEKSVAKPGHSEHQLGTTVDLSGSSISFSSAVSSFDSTVEDLWLRENAHLFGFVMSYPYGKDDITGYKYEPWHYRYLGVNLAKKIKESGLTTTEYLSQN